MAGSLTLGATEFKAKCLRVLDRIGRRELERVIITKRGAAVAVLLPPPPEAAAVEQLPGFLRGSVVIPPEVDLTAPVVDEPLLPIKASCTGEPQHVTACCSARHLHDHLTC